MKLNRKGSEALGAFYKAIDSAEETIGHSLARVKSDRRRGILENHRYLVRRVRLQVQIALMGW